MQGENAGLAPIRLAHESPFCLGDATVYPAMRQIVYQGRSETLEPRIMQVLVALARADGAILSRDDLIVRCWNGCAIGDNAIQRTVSKIRDLGRNLGGAFRLETIAKVGYRLILDSAADQRPPDPVEAVATGMAGAQKAVSPPVGSGFPPSSRPDRRLAIAGVGVGGLAAVTAGIAGWRLTRRTPAPQPAATVLMPPKVITLVARAIEALGDPSPASMMRAIALCQQAVEQAPRYADGWGALALAYALISHQAPSTAKAMNMRALAAIDRALELDPGNAYAWSAKGRIPPERAWLERERILRQGLAFHPDAFMLLSGMASVRANTGRMREAADLVSRAVTAAPQLTSNLAWFHIFTLWSANRLAEADQAAAEAIAVLPREIVVWFNRVYLLIFTGRCGEALAMLADRDARPPSTPDTDFDDMIALARAMNTGLKADTDRAAGRLMAAAHRGAGYAEHGIEFLSALGRVDDAFAVAEANFFNRGFTVSAFRYAPIVARYTPPEDRRPMYLFSPAARSMRRDPRFPKLVDELGLVRYWKESGSLPDYLGKDGNMP